MNSTLKTIIADVLLGILLIELGDIFKIQILSVFGSTMIKFSIIIIVLEFLLIVVALVEEGVTAMEHLARMLAILIEVKIEFICAVVNIYNFIYEDISFVKSVYAVAVIALVIVIYNSTRRIYYACNTGLNEGD